MSDELKKFARAWRSGNPLARTPDLSLSERLAAEAVINHLDWQLKSLESPPQRQLSPDVLAVLECGRRIGFEVTEFCDENYIERKQAIKKGKLASSLPRIWDQVSIQSVICARLVKKVQKRDAALLSPDGTWCDPLNEYFIVIHTDEPLIAGEPHVADAALREIAPVALSHVTRAFFLIWYVPKSAGPRPRIYPIPIC